MRTAKRTRFYRNQGGHGFQAVSWTGGAFLDEDGKPSSIPYDWGLSVMFRDIDGDGTPDLYVCNDFHSPDRVWLNDGRGRFRALPRLGLRQTSIFSMGVDFADLDRDGRDDFFVADMLSRKHANRQIQLMDRRPVQLPVGLIEDRPQYSRNTLFWNRGDGTYAELAHYAGVQASEWSWCPVFLDVDLDGFEDLLLVTGHLRDAQNIDIARRIEALSKGGKLSKLERLHLRRLFTPLRTSNIAFRNRGDLTFADAGPGWRFDSTRVCQGIAVADLDNDGDLDLAINCLDDGPLILRNDSSRPRVAVRLRGLPPNTRGIGARIKVLQKGIPAQSQQMLCGGHYLSGDDPIRVFAAASVTNETDDSGALAERTRHHPRPGAPEPRVRDRGTPSAVAAHAPRTAVPPTAVVRGRKRSPPAYPSRETPSTTTSASRCCPTSSASWDRGSRGSTLMTTDGRT